MISTLLSRLPATKAADWGYEVTVCIGILCNQGQSIVTVTDRKVTFGDFSADNLAIKHTPLWANWYALVAGNDVEHAKPILSRAKTILSESGLQQKQDDVLTAIGRAYSERLDAEITAKILRRRGFNIETFREHGKSKCTREVYFDLCTRIDQIRISLSFLICGFDEEATGHIFCIDGKSAPKSYDDLGMWAIGEGASAALSSLAFHIDAADLTAGGESEEEALYFALTAKFMAESSGTVGRSTLPIILRPGPPANSGFISLEDIEAIRKLWQSAGAPRKPSRLSETLKGRIHTIGEYLKEESANKPRAAKQSSEQRSKGQP